MMLYMIMIESGHVSNIIVLGTEYLVRGNSQAASYYAALAYCFEQHIACNLRKERLMMNWPKINELYFDPDEHKLLQEAHHLFLLGSKVQTSQIREEAWHLLQHSLSSL